MKKYLITALTLLSLNIVFAQTTYTFNGNGYWTIAANWLGNTMPPSVLPAGSTINISPATGDSCVLNTAQTISAGATLNISSGANFIILGNLTVAGINITLCNQLWMVKNLDVSTYRDGSIIPKVTDSSQWAAATSGAWCWYRNDSATYAAIYGRLYNWYAINDPRGLAPAGWHVSSNAEWATMFNCIGYDSAVGGKLKDTTHWNQPNTGASNSSSFKALPGGLLDPTQIPSFFGTGNYGYWWTSADINTDYARSIHLSYSSMGVFNDTARKNLGMSVRILKDAPPTIPTIYTNSFTDSVTAYTAKSGGNITADGRAPVTRRGVCWSIHANPTIADSTTFDGTGTGYFTSRLTGLLPATTYFIRAYATNNAGTGYGYQYSFTTKLAPDSSFTDLRDGQVYTYRRIGDQLWMTRNLNYVTDSSWCYDNSTTNCDAYGRLYTWYAANLAAPAGWHLPADVEWERLKNAFGGINSGGNMKAMTLWNSPNVNATNSSGFTGLPGGLRYLNGLFNYLGDYGFWWSATDSSATNAAFHQLFFNGVSFYGGYAPKGVAYSVRCVKNESPIVATDTFTSILQNTATCGGHIINDVGTAVTARGLCWSTAHNPTIADSKTNDGAGNGSFTSILTALAPNTTYYARAYATNTLGTGYGDEIKFITKGPLPTVTLSPVVYYTEATATAYSYITDSGNSAIISRGVCWDTLPAPTILNSKTVDSSVIGRVVSDITGLSLNTTYYIRAYATNAQGTSYSNESRITTLGQLNVFTNGVGPITQNTATVYGSISNSAPGIMVTTRGICYSLNPGPTTDNGTVAGGSGAGDYFVNLINLNSNSTYYARAYGISSTGITVYGNEIVFTTALPLATVTTSGFLSITQTSAIGGGNVTNSGGSAVTARGICWNTTGLPTITNSSKTVNGSGTGSFSSNLTGLIPGTLYYVRAYATNSSGTAYGSEYNFTTVSQLPVLTTTSITAITQTTAASGGNIASNGGFAVTVRGVCWSTSPAPTINNSKTVDGSGNGTFASSLAGLVPNTVYYVRAYATNSAGTGYGSEVSFTTVNQLPILTTTAASIITQFTATAGGIITADGGLPITERGVCWSTTTNPTIANSKTTDGPGSGVFSSNITGLTQSTFYYFRAYATNSAGTAYGNQLYFTTLTRNQPAVLTTAAVTNVSFNAALSGGNITDNGGSTVTARGVCWGTTVNPTIVDNKTVDGSGTGSFTSTSLHLNPNTLYYLRAYATNTFGTAYGNQQSFTTPQGDSTFTDPRDGQVYTFKHIGSQVWMTQNLNYNTASGSWCYDNNTGNCNIYGHLYDWNTALTIAPPGWHLPSDSEWAALFNTLGGAAVAGGKMKATILWNSPNTGADNSSGFAAYPGGIVGSAGVFNNIGSFGTWWSSTPIGTFASGAGLNRNSSACALGTYTATYGVSVRCIRN